MAENIPQNIPLGMAPNTQHMHAPMPPQNMNMNVGAPMGQQHPNNNMPLTNNTIANNPKIANTTTNSTTDANSTTNNPEKSKSRKLTKEQRIFCLQKYWQHDKEYSAIVRSFNEKYPNTEPPTRHTLRNLNKKFEQTGSVMDMMRSGRPKTVTISQNVNAVREAIVEKRSVRATCAELGISKTSMMRIVKELNNPTPTKHKQQQQH